MGALSILYLQLVYIVEEINELFVSRKLTPSNRITVNLSRITGADRA